jgi:hypothetical protein
MPVTVVHVVHMSVNVHQRLVAVGVCMRHLRELLRRMVVLVVFVVFMGM